MKNQIVSDVEIRKPSNLDIKELHQLFQTIVTDTFQKEGISEMQGSLNEEIATKKVYLQQDLNSNGMERYFLVASHQGKLIGTIEYGPSSELIRTCTNGTFSNLVEVGTIFVHPDFQNKGIGNKLLNTMCEHLQAQKIFEFCLDSGYKNAQKVWQKKFGTPDFLLLNYWGVGFDHMIWKISINTN
ncbi:GNAT family N-acetyltransferase [Sutcliffiella rhizosphaerae]|nr:GNAT family N-acetyltransferase [Sutcliffiella rhizosphaerae]